MRSRRHERCLLLHPDRPWPGMHTATWPACPATPVGPPPPHLRVHPQNVQQLLHHAEAVVEQLHALVHLKVLVYLRQKQPRETCWLGKNRGMVPVVPAASASEAHAVACGALRCCCCSRRCCPPLTGAAQHPVPLPLADGEKQRLPTCTGCRCCRAQR